MKQIAALPGVSPDTEASPTGVAGDSKEEHLSSCKRRLIGVAVSAASLAIPLISAGGAQAATGAGGCILQGNAAIGGTPGYVQTTGGTGTYQFNNSLVFDCATATASTAPTADVSVDALTTSSAGSFTNIVCGTGTVASNAGQNSGTAANVVDLGPTTGQNTALWSSALGSGNNLAYTLTFAGGQGLINLTESSPQAITSAGLISIQPGWNTTTNEPLQGGSNPQYCTNQFVVEGALLGALGA